MCGWCFGLAVLLISVLSRVAFVLGRRGFILSFLSSSSFPSILTMAPYDPSKSKRWIQENNFEVKETAKTSWTVVDFNNLSQIVEMPKCSTSNVSFSFKLDAQNKNIFGDYAYLKFCPDQCQFALRFRVAIDTSSYEEFLYRNDDSKYSDSCIVTNRYSDYYYNRFDLNGVLNVTLHFEVDVMEPKPVKTIETVDIQGHVLGNYQNLLESGDYSDFVLLVGGNEFCVHKVILAAQSEVFAEMFNADLDEKKLNRAEICDMEVDVCQQMLNHIYGAKVDKLTDMAVELMVAADKYQLKHLKSICERSQSLSLTAESVVNAFVLADMHQADELKSECIAFIGANSAVVKSTESWKMMKAQPDLLMELFDKLSIK